MGDTPFLFSLLFFAIGMIFVALGIYIIYIDPKVTANRIFFSISILLFLWAFGFSIAISAANEEICLFWRRFSAIGWGSVYSFILHFFLLLTEHDKLLKKRWVYFALYLPAAIILYVFAISTDMAALQYKLVETPYGWINLSVSNAWDWFFNLYYISFTVGGLWLVWRWGRRSSVIEVKRQARLIIAAFLSALFLGTITDIIANAYLSFRIPQIAPIIILIPITAIYYSMKRYQLLSQNPVNEDEQILTHVNRFRIVNYISITFLAGGFLHFISQYLMNDNLNLLPTLVISVSLAFAGLMVQVVLRLKLENDRKDIINTVIISIVIPVIILKYTEFGSITIWAAPFIFMIIALVFNKRIVLIGIAVSTLLTQALVWIIAPEVNVVVNQADHIGRIGLFGIAIWLAFYVNKVYILRLKENADQIGLQKMISEISSNFVNIDQSSLDLKKNHMLEKIGEFFQVDRAYIFLFDLDKNTMNLTNEWCSEGTETVIESMEEISIDLVPWYMNQIFNKRVVRIPNVEELPEEASEEKFQFMRRNLQSTIAIPIEANGIIQGFIGLDSVRSLKKWSDDHVIQLKIIANILADALAKVKAEKEINYLAYHDHLTKLPNRLLFRDRLKQAIYLSNRSEKMVGVIFIDLDSFKNVNDTMGHEGGDELIKKVAEKLSGCVRKSDTVSRIGGDEFLVMITHLSKTTDMDQIAENIISQFSMPFVINNREFYVTASAGVAIFPQDGADTETLIKNADIAMYSAKDKGKNQYVVCSTDLMDEAHKKLKLINNLYRAQERNELTLYYQPQINMETEEIIGLEALIRWEHPELGMISPVTFIPLAEQTGLIYSIGEWTLRTACNQNKAWQNMGLTPLRMAVNISVNQFRNPNLVDHVNRALIDSGLDPKYLELEITENIAIREPYYIIDVLNHLKELGISISIDDFGTEYSSLSRLTMLPIDRIKIDMQFIQGIEGNKKDKAITDNIISLAKNLGLRVIAEGVESKEQLDFLNKRMCDEVQGFYYYKPMAAEEIEALLIKINKDKGAVIL